MGFRLLRFVHFTDGHLKVSENRGPLGRDFGGPCFAFYWDNVGNSYLQLSDNSTLLSGSFNLGTTWTEHLTTVRAVAEIIIPAVSDLKP